jgi:hypothetical protein
MTANEMAISLEESLDRRAFASPGYEDSDLTAVLNRAFLQYIKTYSRNLNQKQKAFEEVEERGQAFSNLIKYSVPLVLSSNQLGVKPNGFFYDLPEDFMWSINEDIKVRTSSCPAVLANIRVVTHDEYNQLIKDSYAKPEFKLGEAFVWRMYAPREIDFYSPSIANTLKRHQIVLSSDMTLTSYKVSYLKYPPKIIVDRDNALNQRHCILDEITHDTIVDIAVDLLIEDTYRQKQTPDVKNFE